jgi:inhibitor of KinA
VLRFAPLGDRAVTVTFGDAIAEATHTRIYAAVEQLEQSGIAGLTELVAAFTSITVHYEPLDVRAAGDASPYDAFVATLRDVLRDFVRDFVGDFVGDRPANAPAHTSRERRVVQIPVCYGGDFGPDLDDVARQHGITADDVVRIHTAGDYLVYMVGFMPGFAYLGGLSDAIATPRRTVPRTAVPAGTVGIGGQQTGVYPLVSPGGWNLLGRTPLKMFDPARDHPTLLAAGDRVRFHAISLAEFRQIKAS